MDAQEGMIQDALPEGGQPSAEKPAEPSAPKTFTEEEVNKRHSKLDKALADQQKVIEGLRGEKDALAQAREEATQQLEELRSRFEEVEDSELSSEPEQLQARKMLRELTKVSKELEKEKLQVASIKKEQYQSVVGAKMAETAVRHSISVADLEQELEDLGISDPAKFEKVAARMAARKAPKETPLMTDSGLTVGGRGEPTPEQLEKMSMDEYKAYRNKQKQKR